MGFLDNLLEFEEGEAPPPRDDYIRAPFAWPGGKFNSLKHIIPKLPKGKVYVEPCGGSGVVLLNLHHDYPLKVFNDRYGGVVAFYRCLRDPLKKDALIAWLKLTVHSREDFIWCKESWENCCQDDVERSGRWYYMLRSSFASLGRNWGRSTSCMAVMGKKLQNDLDGFNTIHRGLHNVQVENQDVLTCIKDYDSADTVFYVDPDYIGTDTGIYKHSVAHKSLLNLIFESKGHFIVSSYLNLLYESYDWDERYEWDVHSTIRPSAFNEGNNLQGKENVMGLHDTRTEILYIRHSR